MWRAWQPRFSPVVKIRQFIRDQVLRPRWRTTWDAAWSDYQMQSETRGGGCWRHDRALKRRLLPTRLYIPQSSKDCEEPMLKSLGSFSIAAQIDVRPCFTFNSIGQKTAICCPAAAPNGAEQSSFTKSREKCSRIVQCVRNLSAILPWNWFQISQKRS